MIQAKNIFFMTVIALIAIGTHANSQPDSLAKQSDERIGMNSSEVGVYIPNAVVINEKLHPTANLSYKVAGKRYYPTKIVSEDFVETGRASWYGPGFHGRKTASGERFDMNMMTAAHPTLPIPSYARVTNLVNGKAVIVRINDRGPFHGNRVIDLSKAAANKLDFLKQGVTQVKIEPIMAKKHLELFDHKDNSAANVSNLPRLTSATHHSAEQELEPLVQSVQIVQNNLTINSLLKLVES